MLLIDYIPFGLNYQDVKEQFPDIGPVRPEGGTINRKPAYGSLCSHRLYSYYFMVGPVNEDAADALYNKLKSFYNERFGQYTEEKQKENGYTSRSSRWEMQVFELSAYRIKNINEEHYVS